MIVNIKPFKAKFTDKENVTKLSLRIIGDDLTNSCSIYWALLSDVDEVKAEGNHSFSGQDYAQWDGGNDYLIKNLAAALPVEIIK
jgi:hypothetical protein